MGRALVREPSVFLLDEPLSNLDAQLRVQVRAEIKQVQRRARTTMLYVTHDQVEAMTLGDRVAVLERGRLRQVASPSELYAEPADCFVAGFLGNPPMNLLPAQLEPGPILRIGGQRLELPRSGPGGKPRAPGPLTVGLRPESLEFEGASSHPCVLAARAMHLEYLGHETLVHVQLDPEDPAVPRIVARLPGMRRFERGELLRLRIDPAALHFFDSAGRSLRPKFPD
jgi:ABC-type sugar transport system ATPase subunit